MTKVQPSYRSLVHTPAELADEYVKWAENLQDAPGVSFGLESIDEVVIPFHPGDMIVVCGRPGHGKTSIMAYLARAEATRIQERDAVDREAIIYVTWEQVAEELESVFQQNAVYSASDLAWGKVKIEDVRKQVISRAGLPIWIVGESLARSGRRTPRMTTNIVFEAIASIAEDFNGVQPVLLLLDYIQLIPVQNARERIQQVSEAAHLVKELAKRVKCPIVVGAQARRDVDDRDWRVPGLRDVQWASAIEQTCDKFFGVWRPYITQPRGRDGAVLPIKVAGKNFEVTENLLVLQLLKQRFEQGRHTWTLYFDPELLKLAEMERNLDDARF